MYKKLNSTGTLIQTNCASANPRYLRVSNTPSRLNLWLANC